MIQAKGGDGAAEQQVQTTVEHPDRIRALRRFRARLLDFLEDVGAVATVAPTGEGGAEISVILAPGEYGVLTLKTDETQ